MYIERYSKDESQFKNETAKGLQPLIDAALEFTKLKEYLGRDEPTVITVSTRLYLLWRFADGEICSQ
jgi:phosphoglucomutase